MTGPRLVVCGEALLDVFTGADTPTGLALEARIGGSPLNAAIGLARLGQPVAFLGAISRDVAGQRLLRALRDEGVDTALVQAVDAPTTLSLVGVDAAGVPSYAFYGHGGAERQLHAHSLPALPDTVAALQLGSYALVVEPVGSALQALVAREGRRRLVAVDLNVRPGVEPSMSAWRAALAALLPHVDLLKLSEEDLALLHPGEPVEALAAAWQAAGVAWVVLTRGARGAQAWTRHGPVSVPARPVRLADTVGAGDAFQAALLAWLAEHALLSPAGVHAAPADAVAQALGFAAAAAAVACGRRGADLPRRTELPD